MQNYLSKEDVRRFSDCPRKAWFGLRRGRNQERDQDPFQSFLADEAGRIRQASERLFDGLTFVKGSIKQRIQETREYLAGQGDFCLKGACIECDGFVSKPTFLVRRSGSLLIINASAKAGDWAAHRSGKMLVTMYGKVRSEWRDLVEGLAYDCEIASRASGLEVSPYLVLPCGCRPIGKEEAKVGVGACGDCQEDSDLTTRRTKSVLRFFGAATAVEICQERLRESLRRIGSLSANGEGPKAQMRYGCRNCEFDYRRCWGELGQTKPHLFDLHQLYSLKHGNGTVNHRVAPPKQPPPRPLPLRKSPTGLG